MIELHERLSEFSYGYGVTREIEKCLDSVGIKGVPYLPNLLDEAKLGYDVAFKKPGRALLIQFKLGQSLSRFHRKTKSETIPALCRPFWRFTVNTAEPNGQFETLLKAELDGAEVYYAAPRFTDWADYLEAFEQGTVLEQSILVQPYAIRGEIIKKGDRDGNHRIVYDGYGAHICSKPGRIPVVGPAELSNKLRNRILQEPHSLNEAVRELFNGLYNRRLVRRETPMEAEHAEEVRDAVYKGRDEEEHRTELQHLRERRLKHFLARTKSEDDAVALALGTELWALGIQMILATPISKS